MLGRKLLGHVIAMLIKKECERRGEFGLVQTQFVGLGGQVESTIYEIIGPQPARFSDMATARTWFDSAVAASESPQIESA